MKRRRGLTPLSVAWSALAFRFSPRITHLILHVTSRCPRACRTCFVAKGGADLGQTAIRTVAAALPHLLWLDIGGGEPFLRDDLPEICGAFDVPDIAIPTSGYDPQRIRALTGKILDSYGGDLTVGVSLDGFRVVNDSLRGDGSYDGAVETIRLLAGTKGLTVKVNTVLTRDTLDGLPEFMRFVQALGVDYQSLLLLRGTPADGTLRPPPAERLRRAEEEIFAILDGYSYGAPRVRRALMRRYHRLLWKTSLAVLEGAPARAPCLAGRGHLVIYADGDAAPCELVPAVGNIHRAHLQDIIGGKEMGKATAPAREGRCSCTHNCNLMENLLFDGRSALSLLRG